MTSCFAILSVIYALSLPNYFTSQSTLYPVLDDADTSSSISSMASRFGGIASVAGITLPSGNGASKTDIMLATINSREFFSHLLTFEGIRENIFATESYNPSEKKIDFDPDIYDSTNNKWLDGVPTDLQVHKLYKQQILDLSQDKASGLITINVTHKSPIFAQEFLDLIISEINNIMRQRDIVETSNSLKYLTEQLANTNQADVRFSIGQLIESQLKKQMLTKVRKFYILNPIDRPVVPEEKSKPKRSEIVITYTILGFIISILFAISKHYAFIFKDQKS